jgi:hypothetical protein
MSGFKIPTSAEIRKARRCPNWAGHTPHPKGDVAHAEWATEQMNQGRVQRKCPGCGLWAIWEEQS